MTEAASGLPLPPALVASARREGRAGWLASLPGTVARLARAWSLVVEAPFVPGGQTAWVTPVRDRAGDERVLKIGWRHPEAEHEANGLRVWAGHGAVRLHAAERTADTIALLLERCRPGTPLSVRPEPEQDEAPKRSSWTPATTVTASSAPAHHRRRPPPNAPARAARA
jgi:streptomycin 6-kinase